MCVIVSLWNILYYNCSVDLQVDKKLVIKCSLLLRIIVHVEREPSDKTAARAANATRHVLGLLAAAYDVWQAQQRERPLGCLEER